VHTYNPLVYWVAGLHVLPNMPGRAEQLKKFALSIKVCVGFKLLNDAGRLDNWLHSKPICTRPAPMLPNCVGRLVKRLVPRYKRCRGHDPSDVGILVSRLSSRYSW